MSSSMRSFFSTVLMVVCSSVGTAATPAPLRFELTFDGNVCDRPFTGRVYVFVSKIAISALPTGPNWFRPDPCLAIDVKDWRPGQVAVVDDHAVAYPHGIAKLSKGTYTVMAVMDLDRGTRSFSAAEGNIHSKPLRQELDPAASGPIALHLDQVHRARPFQETATVKLVDIESKLLSAFHGRPVHLRAGVVLPASYATSPKRRYPVVYEVPGFGGTHFGAFARAERKATELDGLDVLHVVLDPDCRLGHHVFADSENNGPCGKALVEELIPAIDSRFRTIASSKGRVVTGHSSGGWSSLWLQVTYPEVFAGTWSTSPDPVDFRDFQCIDIYHPGVNMFTDDKGEQRPLARMGAKPVLFYKGFSDMEEVMGHGGQLASFEGVFSPRGPDGRPRRLWDRKTGAIDQVTARAWERYDIRLVLERNWRALGPKLAGKLHVYTGGLDTFYLEGAVARLKESLDKLGSDAVIEIVPGRDHGNILDDKMRQRIAKEMAACLRSAGME
jgi:S-formylglutathione hydrolase FrmB